MSKEKGKPPVLIDAESLTEQTLVAVLESFILREGTDYGAVEISLQQKIINLRKRIDRQEIVLVFDPESESLNFLTETEWQRALKLAEEGAQPE